MTPSGAELKMIQHNHVPRHELAWNIAVIGITAKDSRLCREQLLPQRERKASYDFIIKISHDQCNLKNTRKHKREIKN